MSRPPRSSSGYSRARRFVTRGGSRPGPSRPPTSWRCSWRGCSSTGTWISVGISRACAWRASSRTSPPRSARWPPYLTFAPLIVGPGIKTGVSVATDNPREVGADRVMNALAAFSRYGGPAVVVDFGTSTNFDVVSAGGEFVGGVIGPGIQVAAASLVSRTARLPRVELVAPPSVIGKNTVECIQSALIFGTADMVDGIVERITDELGAQPTTVATGGLAPIVIPHCRSIEHHEPWLTLEGLRLVHARNADPADA